MRKLPTIGIVVLLLGLVLSVPLKVNALQNEKDIIEQTNDLTLMQSTCKIIQEILKMPVFDETIFLLSIPILWIFLLIREIIYNPIEFFHQFFAFLIRMVGHQLITIKQGLK